MKDIVYKEEWYRIMGACFEVYKSFLFLSFSRHFACFAGNFRFSSVLL